MCICKPRMIRMFVTAETSPLFSSGRFERGYCYGRCWWHANTKANRYKGTPCYTLEGLNSWDSQNLVLWTFLINEVKFSVFIFSHLDVSGLNRISVFNYTHRVTQLLHKEGSSGWLIVNGSQLCASHYGDLLVKGRYNIIMYYHYATVYNKIK